MRTWSRTSRTPNLTRGIDRTSLGDRSPSWNKYLRLILYHGRLCEWSWQTGWGLHRAVCKCGSRIAVRSGRPHNKRKVVRRSLFLEDPSVKSQTSAKPSTLTPSYSRGHRKHPSYASAFQDKRIRMPFSTPLPPLSQGLVPAARLMPFGSSLPMAPKLVPGQHMHGQDVDHFYSPHQMPMMNFPTSNPSMVLVR